MTASPAHPAAGAPLCLGPLPEIDPAVGFFDTGAQLVTAKPVDGVPSITVEEGLKLCWG